MTSRRGGLLVAAAAALWGLWPLWVRATGSGAVAASVGLGIAGLVSLPLALRVAPPRRRTPAAWALLASLGVTDAANVWCYFRALAEGAVAPAVLSHYLAPVLVALAAPVLLGEPRARRTVPALGLALLGTAALVASGRAGPAATAAATTHALALGGASAVFYAANVLLTKRLGRDFADAELMSYHSLVASALLLPSSGLPRAASAWRAAGAGGLVSSLGAGLLYYAGLRRLPAERAGVLTYVEPLAAVLVGWAAFAEAPSAGAAVGGALVLAGGLLVVTDGG